MSTVVVSETDGRSEERRVAAVRVTVSRATLCLPLHEEADVAEFRRSFENDGNGQDSPYFHPEAQAWRSVTMVPRSPLQLNFRTQKLADGLRGLAGVVFGFGVGVFLLTHIPATPKLYLQVTSVAIVCLLLAASLLPFTIGCLLGQLRIDSVGISVTPRLVGFRISWHDLQCWSLEGLQLHLLSRRSDREEIIALHALPPGDRLLVRDIMQSCAGEKEGKVSSYRSRTAGAACNPANLPG